MFNPRDWYWLADDGRLFSSARTSLVDKTDKDFVAWCSGLRNPTRWPQDDEGEQTYASLQDVLTPYGLIAAPSALEATRASRIADLSASCERAIVGGFTSDALGQAHTYPSNIKDQINLMGSVTASILPGLPEGWQTPFWVCDSDGVWAYKTHSAAQIQEAGRVGKAHVVEKQSILDALTAEVLAAETPEDVMAISWPE